MAAPIKLLHESLRPREELLRRGAAAASDDILLAVLLRTGTRGRNVKELAHDILDRLNGLEGLLGATHESLLALKVKGLGTVKALELAAALEIGRRAANQRRAAEPPAMATAAAAHQLLKPLAEDAREENFWVLPLDARNRLIGAPVVVARGTVNTAALHPRDVFAPALRLGAAALICARNHPSGETAPSENFNLEWHREMLAQFSQVKQYLWGDYYPLTGCDANTDSYMAYQLDRPDLQSGILLAFRRQDCETERFTVSPALEQGKAYILTDMDTGEEITLTGGDDYEIAILEKPGSRLIQY
ncbi:MAG: DNA repair protein RadC, partial [Kiritimatiellaeota bacterium]|nr:DNA repair protein RadC [Kiritimatiellota bacterium]